MSTNDDRAQELARYDARGRHALTHPDHALLGGAASLPPLLRAPYAHYERQIAALVRPGHQVLELGAGMGEHTGALLQTGAEVTCIDISSAALAMLAARFTDSANTPATIVGDIERLPVPDASVDIVVSAGALSYGEPAVVSREVFRVLRRGGIFLCVDSLNHNWIYRLNRWRHFRRGNRTLSTLQRMPTMDRIARLSAAFETSDVRYFGSVTWAASMMVPVIGQAAAARFSDRMDDIIRVRRSAFKFVLACKGLRRRS